MQLVGFTWEADTWCPQCLPVEEDHEEVSAIFDIDEWDYDVHCNSCHELLLEGYIKQCLVCKKDLKEGQHVVQDQEDNLMHYLCWKDSLPSDIKNFNEIFNEEIVREAWDYRGF